MRILPLFLSQSSPVVRSAARQIAGDICCSFLLLCALLLPFPLHLLPDREELAQWLFSGFISTEISSDSKGMYLLAWLLFLMSTAVSLLLRLIPKWEGHRAAFVKNARTLLCYFVALCLFKYGFDKVFKAQFYLPEPNTLFTPLGHISKDLLFWSTMGASHTYNVITGLIEIVPAFLLLFKRTRVLGLLIALGVMAHVTAINFSFDISVKVFSLLLLLIILFLLIPQCKPLYDFFILRKHIQLDGVVAEKRSRPAALLKFFVVMVLLTEALFPYLRSMQFNDDASPRPYLHGAYAVADPASGLKRIFIHRRGYIIFQDRNDNMEDFKLEIDQVRKKFILTDYDRNSRAFSYDYDPAGQLELWLEGKKGALHLTAKAVDWKELPLLQNDFHWTVD